jgi:hypothetical protein
MTVEEASAEWGEGPAEDTIAPNSRVRAKRARAELGWQPKERGLIEEIERGCYVKDEGKARESDLNCHGLRQLFIGAPTFDPGLHVAQRDRFPRPLEVLKAASILGDVETGAANGAHKLKVIHRFQSVETRPARAWTR